MPNLHDVQLLAKVAETYERTLCAFINDKENAQSEQLVSHAKAQLSELIAQFEDEEAYNLAVDIFCALDYLLK